MRSDVYVRLRVIDVVSREYRRPQVSKRVGQLLIAPAGLLSGLPGGVGNVSRTGSRFPDQADSTSILASRVGVPVRRAVTCSLVQPFMRASRLAIPIM
jgi:hypothetical protein